MTVVVPLLDPAGPYLSDHVHPNGVGDARPTALKVIRDQKLEGQLSGQVFLITGCTAGLGLETARAIYTTGADVYITGRNDTLGAQVVADLTATDVSPHPSGKIEYIHMELDSFASIRAAAAEFLQKSGGKLNVLIENAGVMRTPEGTTQDGFETQFGTNHLGHFLLFQRVKQALLSSSSKTFQSRVIILSSAGHGYSPILFDNYNLKRLPGGYDGTTAYGQSKTANIQMANEIERRYSSKGLHALSVHPGAIETGLAKHSQDFLHRAMAIPSLKRRFKNLPQGAATTVWAAVGREWEGKGGRYLEDCKEAEAFYPQDRLMPEGYRPHAFDEASEGRLWKESLVMVDEQDDE